MARGWRFLGTTGVWLLALAFALFSARYFLVPPPWLTPPVPAALLQGPAVDATQGIAPHLYAQHRLWLLLHIAGGIVALALGLFQFVGPLRDSQPALHRALGRVYLAAVLLAGSTGLPLSFLILDSVPAVMRPQFFPLVAGFGSLSIVWLWISGVAFSRARQRRFEDHRAWMIRSYCLTFAAVTVRLVGPLFLFLLDDAVVALNGAILSWPLNLIVAEGLIRRARATSSLAGLASGYKRMS